MNGESSIKAIDVHLPESPTFSNAGGSGNQIAEFLKDLHSPMDGSPALPGSLRSSSMGQQLPLIYDIDKEQEITADDFRAKHRHLIVMTSAGKPVYSRYGDEAELSPVVATLNVVVNKLAAIRGQSKHTGVHRIETSTNKTIVVTRLGLIVAVISKDKSDSDNVMKTMADVIVKQVNID